METLVYLRKSGEDRVKFHAVVDVIEESGSTLQFESKTYLSVDSQSHYCIKHKAADESVALWWIELHCSDPMQEPYRYTAVFGRKYRDAPEFWMEDD